MERALGGRGPEVLAGLQRMQALPGNYLDILERYVGHLVVEGIVQGHEDVLRARQRYQKRLSAVQLDKGGPKSGLDAEPVIPADALDFIQRRRELGRFFEADQVDTVRRILAQGLQEGWTTKRTQDELQRQLVGVGRARAHTIARTEATTAFNQGRLAMFRQTDGFVQAVQFLAILDTRTTEMCRARDGLILGLEDPVLVANTPPLHYSCRSYLSPVSRYELEDKGGDDFLARERAKLEGLPRPLPGFDQPEPAVGPATPRPDGGAGKPIQDIDSAAEGTGRVSIASKKDRETKEVIDALFREKRVVVSSNAIREAPTDDVRMAFPSAQKLEERVRTALARQPTALLRHWLQQERGHLHIVGDIPGFPNPGRANRTTGLIEVVAKALLDDNGVLEEEMVHWFDFLLGGVSEGGGSGKVRSEVTDRLQALMAKPAYSITYRGTPAPPREWLAQWYRFFAQDPELLQAGAPEMYDFFQNRWHSEEFWEEVLR